MNNKKRGKILLLIGFIFVFAATAIYAVYDYQDRMAGENAKRLAEAMKQEQKAAAEDFYERASGDMPQTTLAGHSLIGTIQVPSVNIELPVLHDWNYDLLKISPCRYSGSIEDGNLIILGHNYKSHFSPLKQVKVGDTIQFCDVSNTTYTYQVEKTEKLYKTELDALTSADYDLTVFTCTTGGESRFVVRCNLTESFN